jgi:hypothetical protein
MSVGTDIAESLDGPLGWVAVVGVAAVIIYVAYSKTAASVDQTEAQIAGNVEAAKESFSNWFNCSCVVADVWHWATNTTPSAC